MRAGRFSSGQTGRMSGRTTGTRGAGERRRVLRPRDQRGRLPRRQRVERARARSRLLARRAGDDGADRGDARGRRPEEGACRARRGRAGRAPLADCRRGRGGAWAGGREQYRPRADPACPPREARDGGTRTTSPGLSPLRRLPPPWTRAQFAERSLNPLRLRPSAPRRGGLGPLPDPLTRDLRGVAVREMGPYFGRGAGSCGAWLACPGILSRMPVALSWEWPPGWLAANSCKSAWVRWPSGVAK